jgi:hypothetical protein
MHQGEPIMTAKPKSNVPALDLPPRPPSKVEQGLAADAKPDERAAELDAAIAESGESLAAKRERAIAAMVEAGLSQEFAEAAFVLTEDGAEVSPADVAEAVGEAERAADDFGAPLCKHGCHGSSWADIPAERDAVGCEHGSFPRKP